MPRDRDEPAAVRVYTVCDESKYLIARNVPSLGCGDELMKLFGSYGPVEECKPMDAEECEPYTDVFFLKFSQISNARFAKRKLDDSVFLGNHLQVSYAPQFESVSDTKEKLEVRIKEVLRRTKFGRIEGPTSQQWSPQVASQDGSGLHISSMKRNHVMASPSHVDQSFTSHVSSNKEYFPSPSMNETVKLVREKLDKIQSSAGNSEIQAAAKKARVDNRRRI